MSSTNRGAVRHTADYYITPQADIIKFLREFNKEICLEWNELSILDPCAGGDLENEMSYPAAIKKAYGSITIETVDIRLDSRANIKADYLLYRPSKEPDLIITNPPFNIALDIIKKGIIDVKDNGYIVMLLRLNFLESKTRKEFFDQYMPKYIFVHHERMKFIKGKGTDSTAYAHFIWQKGQYPEFAQIKVI